MSDQVVRVRILVRGRVQGVGYRAFTLHEAHRLSLRGTVTNRADGAVECIVEGDPRTVDTLVERLRVGPYHARVDAVDVSEESGTGTLPPMTVTV